MHDRTLLLLALAVASGAPQEAGIGAEGVAEGVRRAWRLENECTALSADCGACIQSPVCAWCRDPGMEAPRCDLRKW